VSKSAIARITQQQGKLTNEWTLRHGQQGTSQKRKCEGKDADYEDALNSWFAIVTGRSVQVYVSCPILKSKSEDAGS
jgi:hypothetical protein